MRSSLSPNPPNRSAVQGFRPSRERARGDATATALMARCARGEGDALGHLYRQCAPVIFAYLRQLCGGRDRAEDLVQTTFLKLHRARGRYVEGSAVEPWLYAIARNSFRDDVRSKFTRHETLDSNGTFSTTRGGHWAPAMELRCALVRALAELSETDRDAFTLTKVWGYAGVEAAGLLRTTPTAVKVRTHRACRKLRASAHLNP